VLDKPEGLKPEYVQGIDLETATTYVREGRWAFVSAC
jgi:hypothetical protein